MGQPPAAGRPDWGAVFDRLAVGYDQSGVPFFGPIARGLADRLALRPGERVAELGCGRGALTLPLADAVGPTGRVDAVDLAPAMVALTAGATADLPQVTVAGGDAASPPLPPASYDVVAASLVLFFLPDPVAALRRWRDLLVEGGRGGVTTFASATPSWAAMEAAFEAALGAGAAGLRGGTAGPFGSDAGVEGLFRAAGWSEVGTDVAVLDVPFRDVDQWQAWMGGTALQGLWAQLDDAGRDRVRHDVGALLDAEGGRVQVAVRHTLARR